MPTVEFNDDSHALEYIRKRGYASYSSIKNVRDKEVPTFFTSPALVFGKELHSRHLEKTQLEKLSAEEEKHLRAMLRVLDESKVVQQLMRGCKTEVEFKQMLLGVMVLGYIDIDSRPLHVSDLKTTSTTSLAAFVRSMDFLQAALYLAVSGAKDFYYIGINKKPPYPLFIFSVSQYPDRLKAARKEMETLLKYLKKKL